MPHARASNPRDKRSISRCPRRHPETSVWTIAANRFRMRCRPQMSALETRRKLMEPKRRVGSCRESPRCHRTSRLLSRPLHRRLSPSSRTTSCKAKAVRRKRQRLGPRARLGCRCSVPGHRSRKRRVRKPSVRRSRRCTHPRRLRRDSGRVPPHRRSIILRARFRPNRVRRRRPRPRPHRPRPARASPRRPASRRREARGPRRPHRRRPRKIPGRRATPLPTARSRMRPRRSCRTWRPARQARASRIPSPRLATQGAPFLRQPSRTPSRRLPSCRVASRRRMRSLGRASDFSHPSSISQNGAERRRRSRSGTCKPLRHRVPRRVRRPRGTCSRRPQRACRRRNRHLLSRQRPMRWVGPSRRLWWQLRRSCARPSD